MTNQPQNGGSIPEGDLEIQGSVDQLISMWRAAKWKVNPDGHVSVADELEMRRCIMEMERVKKGLPIQGGKHRPPGVVEWNVRTYLDAQQSQITEPPWKIKGLVVEGGATQVSAHPHGMKSLSWLNAALESVTLHKAWRYFDATKVDGALYIESEDPEWLVAARIRGIAKGLGLDPDKHVPGFHYVCPGPFDLVKEEESLRELLAKFRPSFAVLSTLQSVLAGRDWLLQKDMQDVNALIVRLSLICPFVVLTHSPWNPKQRRAAGTITQFANYAVAMHYEKLLLNDGGGAIHVKVDSKLGASVDDFHLKLLTEGDESDPSSIRSLIYGGEGRPRGASKDAVLQALEDDPQASTEEIAQQAGVTSRYVREIRAGRTKGRPRKSKRRTHQTEPSEVDLNDPRLDDPQDDNTMGDAYTDAQSRRRRR